MSSGSANVSYESKSAVLPEYSFEEFSPQRAAEALMTSVGNRGVRGSHVLRLAEDMKAGEWIGYGSDAIKFNANGQLVDGHHRLSAVVKAGVTVMMTVVRNLSHDPQRGGLKVAPWNAGDMLFRDGFKNSRDGAAAGSLVIRLRSIWDGTQLTLASSAAQQLIADQFGHDKFLELCCTASLKLKKTRLAATASEVAALMYCAHADTGVASEAMYKFIESLAYGENISRGDTIYTLRTRLADRSLRLQPLQTAKIAMVIKAWNAFVDGKNIGVLKFSSAEQFPAIRKQ